MANKLTSSYSDSLYEAASKDNILNDVAADCSALLSLIAESGELNIVLDSPVISKFKKIAIVNSLFKGKVKDLTLNLILLVIKNRRESFLKLILEGFLHIKDEKDGIIKPVYTTAIELKEDEKIILKKEIDTITSKNSIPSFEVKPELIGGFTLNIGDSIIDGSVKRQLELMRKSLK
ncbi:MAG: ATP synthase F1 subunit delta [Ignavibacteria bacterium]